MHRILSGEVKDCRKRKGPVKIWFKADIFLPPRWVCCPIRRLQLQPSVLSLAFSVSPSTPWPWSCPWNVRIRSERPPQPVSFSFQGNTAWPPHKPCMMEHVSKQAETFERRVTSNYCTYYILTRKYSCFFKKVCHPWELILVWLIPVSTVSLLQAGPVGCLHRPAPGFDPTAHRISSLHLRSCNPELERLVAWCYTHFSPQSGITMLHLMLCF